MVGCEVTSGELQWLVVTWHVMSCHLVRCDCLCCVMSRLLLQYYSALQRTNAALLCTTKYHSSTTLYYKVLQRTTPVLQSTTPVLRILQLLQYNSVLQLDAGYPESPK